MVIIALFINVVEMLFCPISKMLVIDLIYTYLYLVRYIFCFPWFYEAFSTKGCSIFIQIHFCPRDDHIVSVLESVHEMDYNTDLFIMSHLCISFQVACRNLVNQKWIYRLGLLDKLDKLSISGKYSLCLQSVMNTLSCNG